MQFLAPVFLWCLALVPPAIALFLVRRRAERQLTSTLAFFLDLHRHYRESPWLRRVKRLLALLLTVLVLLGIIGALSRPVAAPLDDDSDALFVVIDRSASTGARYDAERSVLAVGLERLQAQLRAVPAGIPVVLIASDVVPTVILPPGADRRDLDRICGDLRARPLPGRHDAALDLARDLAAEYQRPTVWFLGDTAPDQTDSVRFIPLPGPAAGNAGITACRLARRQLESDQVECFLSLQSNDARSVSLEVQIDGELAALRQLELGPGEPRSLILPISAGVGSEIAIAISSETEDALAVDDRLTLPCPPSSSRRIRFVSPAPAPFSELALACLEGGLEMDLLGPGDWRADLPPVDCTIFQHWAPDTLPASGASLLIDPPRPVAPVGLRGLGQGMLAEDLRVHDAGHPLLVGVSSGRIGLLQTAAIEEGGGLTPLWSSAAGTVLAAGNDDGRRIVVLSADPARSGRLPLEASWPTLLANALHWLVPPQGLEDACRTSGSRIELHDAALVWQDGQRQGPGTVRLDRLGRWSSGERQGSVALLADDETMLPPARNDEQDDEQVLGGTDWPWLLMLVVVGLLLGDHLLAHRKGVF